MTEQTLAELSRAVAEKRGWKHLLTDDRGNLFGNPPGVVYRDDIHLTELTPNPARLYELEGELQKAGWSFSWRPCDYAEGTALAEEYPALWLAVIWDSAEPTLYEAGTPEGRATLIMRLGSRWRRQRDDQSADHGRNSPRD